MGKCRLPGCDEWINAATDVYCGELHRIYHKLDMSKQENARLQAELERVTAERDTFKDQIENPKMTYCAFCGQQYDIEDRKKALQLIAEHVLTCEKHPYSQLRAKCDRLESALRVYVSKFGNCGDVYDSAKQVLDEKEA